MKGEAGESGEIAPVGSSSARLFPTHHFAPLNYGQLHVFCTRRFALLVSRGSFDDFAISFLKACINDDDDDDSDDAGCTLNKSRAPRSFPGFPPVTRRMGKENFVKPDWRALINVVATGAGSFAGVGKLFTHVVARREMHARMRARTWSPRG